MKSALFVFAVLTAFASPTNASEPIAAPFADGWIAEIVANGQASLVEESDCQVKGFGWKLLGTRRVKQEGDRWYQRGRLEQKWGWKLVVHNAGETPLYFGMKCELVTDEQFALSGVSFGYGIFSSSPDTYTDLNRVLPGVTRVFTGTGTYWVDEHRGEGKPVKVDWKFVPRILDQNEMRTRRILESQGYDIQALTNLPGGF